MSPALPPITPHQCHDGRRLLGWSGLGLTLRANVEPAALIRFEHELVALDRDTLGRIRSALETVGVEFERGIPRVKDRQGPPIV